MRVAYQAGAIKALWDAGLRFSHLDGASGGTINLAALLSGVDPDALCANWRAMPTSHFASLRPLKQYLHLAHMSALGSSSGLREKVYPALGINLAKINAAQGIKATFNVCRFDDKTVHSIAHTELDMDRLVAAASLPILMPAVQAQGQTWTDAVWIKDANLLSCVAQGARELWLIWCIGNTPVFKHGAFNQYVHMIEMAAIGALNAELAAIADMNQRIANGEVVHGHQTPITVHIVKPEVPLPLDPDFFFGRINAATLIDMGYRDARRALTVPCAPLDPSATRMREPGVGVSFRETMAGSLELNANAPWPAGGALAMHATIHIEDIQAFTADPQHRADLTGHLDFAPLGLAIPAHRGVFGLFTPSFDPRLVYMVYELGWSHAGKDYYLAGKKHVRIGSFWRLWSETTTLHITLHEGLDTSGAVLGSGVLKLGITALLKLLRTLHATNANTGREKRSAVGRFLRFFTAELLRIYAWRK
jgi:predicted acylesterase/phospholipase RssA